MIRFIRAGCRYAKWGVVFAVILALAAALIVGRWFDDEIRNKVQADLAEHYPNLQVSVQSAALVEGEGIHVRGLRLLDPSSSGPNAELAYFDEVLFACQTTKMQLLRRSPHVTRVVAFRPRLRITRRPDGAFSIQKLWPLPESDDPTPVNAVIENATIELIDTAKSPPSLYTFRDVNITLKERQEVTGQDDERVIEVNGRLLADHLRMVTFDGEYHVVSGRWTAQASVEGLDLSPEFHAALPDFAWEPLESLRARAPRPRSRPRPVISRATHSH